MIYQAGTHGFSVAAKTGSVANCIVSMQIYMRSPCLSLSFRSFIIFPVVKWRLGKRVLLISGRHIPIILNGVMSTHHYANCLHGWIIVSE